MPEGSGAGTMGAHGKAMTARSIIGIARIWCNKFGEEQLKATLKGVQYNPKLNLNLCSIGKAIKEGWKLSGNQKGLVMMKESAKLVFDIKIMTKNGVIFCAYLQRDHEISVILTSTGVTMSIEKAHIMTRHHHEERQHKIALELGWSLKKAPMIPCKACLVGKANQLVINKHVDDSKKTTRAGKRTFSDLVTIKLPQDSSITITNQNWHIVVDQYMGYKELDCYCTKHDFVEPTCKNLASGKIMGNQ